MRASVRLSLSIFLALLLLPPMMLYLSADVSSPIYAKVDCYITSWEPETSHAGSSVLKVSRNVQGNETLESRALIRFDLSEAGIPSYSRILNASLILNTYNYSSGVSIEVWDVSGEPDILHTTWLYERSGMPWENPGGDIIVKWGEAPVSSPYVKINITDYVQAFVNGELESTGWLLIKIVDDQEGYFEFYSETTSETGPRIEIEYEPASLELSMDTSDIELIQDGNTSITVYVSGGLSKPVNLTLDGPDFLQYNFSVPSAVPPFTSTLELALPENAPGGTYTIIVRAEGVMEASAPLNLTVVEKKGFLISGPSSVDLKGGFPRNVTLEVTSTGNYSGRISVGILGSPDWLNVSISPSSGNPPFDVVVTLQSAPSINASGILSLLFTGARNKVYEINVTTVRRKVAVYSNSIDWNLSREALLGPTNTSGVPLDRVNSSEDFSNYDVVIVLGGHKAPIDRFMPSNVASGILTSEEKVVLEQGGTVVHVEMQGSTYIVVVAGADRYKTAELIVSDDDGDGKTLAYELITGDPSGI